METKPIPFITPFADLCQTLTRSTPRDPLDPAMPEFLNRHSLLQQYSLAEKLSHTMQSEAFSPVVTSAYLRALALLERTRSRLAREAAMNGQTGPDARDNSNAPDRDEAIQFLRAELSRGERPATVLIAEAQSIGISLRTLRRAKTQLNVVSIQRILPNQDRCWMWSFHTDANTEPLFSHQNPHMATPLAT